MKENTASLSCSHGLTNFVSQQNRNSSIVILNYCTNLQTLDWVKHLPDLFEVQRPGLADTMVKDRQKDTLAHRHTQFHQAVARSHLHTGLLLCALNIWWQSLLFKSTSWENSQMWLYQIAAIHCWSLLKANNPKRDLIFNSTCTVHNDRK